MEDRPSYVYRSSLVTYVATVKRHVYTMLYDYGTSGTRFVLRQGVRKPTP